MRWFVLFPVVERWVGEFPMQLIFKFFLNRESMIAAVPSYGEQYINVPKVLNKE